MSAGFTRLSGSCRWGPAGGGCYRVEAEQRRKFHGSRTDWSAYCGRYAADGSFFLGTSF